ncbi:unnamed protein product [Caretta caretta]
MRQQVVRLIAASKAMSALTGDRRPAKLIAECSPVDSGTPPECEKTSWRRSVMPGKAPLLKPCPSAHSQHRDRLEGGKRRLWRTCSMS